MTDKKKAPSNSPLHGQDEFAAEALAGSSQNRPRTEGARTAPSRDAIVSALQALKRASLETDTEISMHDMEVERQHTVAPGACDICGHQNRPGNQFCGMCGLPLPEASGAEEAVASGERDGLAVPAEEDTVVAPQSPAPARATQPSGHHFYHHHYHHHYFPAGADIGRAGTSVPTRVPAPEATRDPAKVRVPGSGQPLSRAETSVRKVLQDWALACNTKHLDDLVSTYASDALILRPNHLPVRGAAAIREFFVAILDSGFGEAELEPVRLEVFGDVAYEAGRCKALVPIAVSKRREERGKYQTILARQSNGEWKIISDCWSSDVSLS